MPEIGKEPTMLRKSMFVCLLLLAGGSIVSTRVSAATAQETVKQAADAKTAQTEPGKPEAGGVEGAKTAIDPAKEKSIRKLLEVTGSAKLGLQVMQQMLASLRQSQPSVPEEFWTGVSKKIRAEGLVDLIIPIYAKYYTQEDIDGLLAFYQTPLGQKVIATLPQISQESLQAGQQWGRSIAEQVIQELQKRDEQADSAKKDAPKTAPAAKPKTKSKSKN